MSLHMRARAGQFDSAMLRLNQAAVGAFAPQPVEITVGVQVYPSGNRGQELHVPMCSAVVRPCQGWRYSEHRAFEEGGALRFYHEELPLPAWAQNVGGHGIYRVLATVLCRREGDGAIVKPLAAVFLSTMGLEFHPGQYESYPGCTEAAEAFCWHNADRLMRNGGARFLNENGRFNGDFDSLLRKEGQIVMRPRRWLVDVWGRTLDLRGLGMPRWCSALAT